MGQPISPIDAKNSIVFFVQFLGGYPGVLGDTDTLQVHNLNFELENKLALLCFMLPLPLGNRRGNYNELVDNYILSTSTYRSTRLAGAAIISLTRR